MRLALLLSLAFVFVGCTDALNMSDDSFTQNNDGAGSVHIPLVATAADGTTYRLKDATFEVSGSAMVTLSEREAGAQAEELVAPLPAGGYSVYLRPGWKIIEIKPDGSVSDTVAAMAGRNPQMFDLNPMGDSNLKLTFKSADRELSFGSAIAVRVTTAALSND